MSQPVSWLLAAFEKLADFRSPTSPTRRYDTGGAVVYSAEPRRFQRGHSWMVGELGAIHDEAAAVAQTCFFIMKNGRIHKRIDALL